MKAVAGEERRVYLSATEYDYPPFSVTDSGEADGFSVELLKAVAEEMGITVTFKIDQWTVLKEELKNGELDILPLVGYTEERDEIYDFTVPYIVMRGNIFVRTGDQSIQSQEDLFGKEILVLDGDNSQEWAWSIGLDSELTATTTYLEAFELLDGGQYDAVLAQGLVGEKLIRVNGLDNIEPVYIYDDGGVTRQKLNLEGYEQKFCFAVVEGDNELLSILNEGLSIVSINGTYDELYQKWFPFLLDNEGVSRTDIIRYLSYILIPILVLLIAAYFIVTRRTIKIRTNEIMLEKERSEKYLNDLILYGKIFEASIENAPIPIMIHAEDGTVLNISKTWINLTKYSKEDIMTIYDWTEKAYGQKKEEVQDFLKKLYTLEETQHDGEFEVTTKEGRILIWDFYSMHIGDLPDGRAIVMSAATDVTKRTQVENMLIESERSKSLFISNLPGLAFRCNYDPERTMQYVSEGCSNLTGYSPEHLINNNRLSYKDIIAPEYREAIWNEWTHILQTKSSFKAEYEIITASGKRKWVLEMGEGVYNKQGEIEALEGIILDITDQKKAEEELENLLERTQSMINNHESVMLIIEPISGKIMEANTAASTFYGYSKEELLNMTIQDINALDQEEVRELRLKALNKKRKYFTFPHRLKNGEVRVVDVYTSPIDYDDQKVLFSIIFDVTEREKIAKENEFLAYHDYLTGLYNRRFFEEEFERRVKNCEFPVAILLGDLDGFKTFNDTFGHIEGDKVLKETANRIKALINDDDALARVGGDEFSIIVSGRNEREIRQYLDKLNQEFDNDEVDSLEKEVLITISWGYGIQRAKEDSLDMIRKEAEAFMNNRKFYSNQSAKSKTVDVIMQTLFTKSEREKVHSERVGNLCAAIARHLNLSKSEIDKVRVAGYLHDIGKIGIDEKVLNKPGKLDTAEWELMKLHPAKGFEILEKTSEYNDIADVILAHHERCDGKGYPNGLTENEIPLMAKIIAVCDAYDAMTEQRTYREPLSKIEAMAELNKCSGTQFDPEIVSVFLNKVIEMEKTDE